MLAPALDCCCWSCCCVCCWPCTRGVHASSRACEQNCNSSAISSVRQTLRSFSSGQGPRCFTMPTCCWAVDGTSALFWKGWAAPWLLVRLELSWSSCRKCPTHRKHVPCRLDHSTETKLQCEAPMNSLKLQKKALDRKQERTQLPQRTRVLGKHLCGWMAGCRSSWTQSWWPAAGRTGLANRNSAAALPLHLRTQSRTRRPRQTGQTAAAPGRHRSRPVAAVAE
jgi:hypothetical protein